ncbi:MAG: hypothetical protein AAFX93_15545 [Verrucomicrobiota bacterium]
MITQTESTPSDEAYARVYPRRRHRFANCVSSDVDDQSVKLVFSAPLERSEVRRRFAGIYEQAYRIAYRDE